MVSSKKPRISYDSKNPKPDSFDKLPDDLLISILSKLSSSSSSPPDFFNALLACKRFYRLGINKEVLSNACSKVFAIKAKLWSESAHRFLKLCVTSGSVEASYFLGMIRFYCLENRGSGKSLMARAAIRSHAPALYSLAVIQFNGSGGAKTDKDLRAGVSLCARAAYLGHVDAHRELGHCLQDGYGVQRNISEGRRILVQANARELASVLPNLSNRHVGKSKRASTGLGFGFGFGFGFGSVERYRALIMSDYGCNVPAPDPHPANQFLIEWFEEKKPGQDIRLCSHAGCGRVETRAHEFRRCSVCGTVNYCSRGCQAMDWKLRHKVQCNPIGLALGLGLGLDLDIGVAGGAPVDEANQVGM